MLKTIFTALLLSSIQLASASSFGPLPISNFGPDGNLACTSKEKCPVPTQKSLQKIGEDFLSHTSGRLDTLGKIESEIRSSIQTYQQHSEEVFSRVGNTELKSFLEKGQGLYEGLLSSMGLSTARVLVSGKSPFLLELNSLIQSLKALEADKINAKSKTEIVNIKTRATESYFNFRNKGSFESYKLIGQVKTLSDFYEKAGSLEPWFMNTKRQLRLKFENCPVAVRRTVKKYSPSLRFDKSSKPFQIEIFEEFGLAQKLVQNGRLLTISCEYKKRGALSYSIQPLKSQITIQYTKLSSGREILPKF